jgi:YggT family protein
MIALGNLLMAIAGMLATVINIFYFLIIGAVILSWVSPDPRNPIVQFIYNTTEPIFSKVRKYVRPVGMLDLSPIVVLLALYFINAFIVASLADYGAYIKQSSVGL